MNENELLSKKFAKNFNKKYGVITYSGTLAIEVALKTLKLEKNSKVLVSSEVCYSIVNTILKLGLKPVIVVPANGLYLTTNDIDKTLETQDIRCIVLVHQYGILNDLYLKKYNAVGIKIIEDVAQAWNIGNSEYTIGEYSDIVVTSFGKTKPLSYGIGGGLFSNDVTIMDSIDYADNRSRENENILLSYAYPLCEKIDYEKLVELAYEIVDEQRNNSKEYYNLLSSCNFVKCMNYDEKNVWHRFPIWVDDYDMYKKIIDVIKSTELEYQLPHEINLCDLKRNKNCIVINNKKDDRYFILLRTRNININKQIKSLKEIINNIVP